MIVNALNMMSMAMSRSDALSRIYSNNDAMLGMLIKTPVPPIQPVSFLGTGYNTDVFVRQKDLNMELENIQAAIRYKVATANEQSLKEAQDKKIKRSFSWWA